jgi:hypothetical protein
MTDVWQILAMILPAALVLFGMYVVIKGFADRELGKMSLDYKKQAMEQTLPLRLQAYERMTLYLDRLSLENLLTRLLEPGLSAEAYALRLKIEIKQELDHNVAQQIYVTEATWEAIREAKRGVESLIDQALQAEDKPAEATTLGKKILSLAMEANFDKPAQAMAQLKKDVKQLF